MSVISAILCACVCPFVYGYTGLFFIINHVHSVKQDAKCSAFYLSSLVPRDPNFQTWAVMRCGVEWCVFGCVFFLPVANSKLYHYN